MMYQIYQHWYKHWWRKCIKVVRSSFFQHVERKSINHILWEKGSFAIWNIKKRISRIPTFTTQLPLNLSHDTFPHVGHAWFLNELCPAAVVFPRRRLSVGTELCSSPLAFVYSFSKGGIWHWRLPKSIPNQGWTFILEVYWEWGVHVWFLSSYEPV